MGKRISGSTEHYWYKAFLLGLFFSAAFFVPYIVIGHGYFLYYGDFNVQQVPFYQMVHDAIRNGQLQWSTTTDLGSSLVGSYTFYLLGSPFFWLTLPFPSKMVPYLMGPLLILKFGSASLTGYIYIRRYTRDKNMAVIGGLLYAFSGFSVYNVFFNHFHEAIVFFPLLLAAIDEYMDNQRKGVVALAVFWACLVNYYFFVAMVMFVIIYWFLRMFTGSYKLAPKDLLPLAFEVVIGFAGTAVLLWPTVLFVTQNPRLNDAPMGYDALLYGWEQRYLHIISSMFFPPDIPARPNFTPDSNAKWGSVAAWLPMFGMTGVIAFLQSRSKSWLKKLLPFLFVCTLVPILNAIFQMFVMTYYARWFFMLTLMMALATVKAIENTQTKWRPAIALSLVITLFITLTIGLLPNGNEGEYLEWYDTLGLEKYSERFWIYCAIAMMSIAAVTILIRTLKNDRKKFFVKATACLGVISVLYSGYIIGLGKSHSYDIDNFVIPHVLNNGKGIGLSKHDLQNTRSDFYETMDNVGMYWQIPNIQAFQSVVPGSIYLFYPSVGVTRDVGSRPEPKYYGLRSLLSVKFLFDYAGDDDSFTNDEGKMKMPGYRYLGKQNEFNIYENKCYIPYGFWYDKYITTTQYDTMDVEKRHLLILKAMVLDDETAEKYGGLMENMTNLGKETYDVPSYKKDCETLKGHACEEFEYGTDSFTASITLPEDGGDKLIFFSVPYENGWSATLNGEPIDIACVNVGFMGVVAKAGQTNNFEFTYRTPGLYEGALVTAVSFVIFAAYLIICKKNNTLKPRLKLKKSYKVAAIGSSEELGDRYKNLRLGRNGMKKTKARTLVAPLESGGETEKNESGSEEDTSEGLPETQTETAAEAAAETETENQSVSENETSAEESAEDNAAQGGETQGGGSTDEGFETKSEQ